MSDLERNKILASFVNNSSDMAAIGYPYGFVDADNIKLYEYIYDLMHTGV